MTFVNIRDAFFVTDGMRHYIFNVYVGIVLPCGTVGELFSPICITYYLAVAYYMYLLNIMPTERLFINFINVYFFRDFVQSVSKEDD